MRRIVSWWSTARPSSFLGLEDRLNRTISPRDSLYPHYQEGEYFRSALRQLDTVDALLHTHGGRRLRDHVSIADYACHYGRLLRCLRAALPTARLYAYDIDAGALEFCAREFGCVPIATGWRPADTPVSATHDLIISASLVTHTRLAFFRGVLELWERMLEPGALLLFTYLGERYLEEWVAGRLRYGGNVEQDAVRAGAEDFRRHGHAFCGNQTSYSQGDDYGIAFMQDGVVAAELERRPSLRLLECLPGQRSTFGQDLAVVRKTPPNDRPRRRLLSWRRPARS